MLAADDEPRARGPGFGDELPPVHFRHSEVGEDDIERFEDRYGRC